MDVFSTEKRSWVMSRIQGKDTKPEKTVRSILHHLGYRFRLNSRLPGKPDIVLRKYNTVIFVHGCFWHRHKNCKYCYMPKTRQEFWSKKFLLNIKRDKQVAKEIRQMGWNQLTIWECEIKDRQQLEAKIRGNLDAASKHLKGAGL